MVFYYLSKQQQQQRTTRKWYRKLTTCVFFAFHIMCVYKQWMWVEWREEEEKKHTSATIDELESNFIVMFRIDFPFRFIFLDSAGTKKAHTHTQPTSSTKHQSFWHMNNRLQTNTVQMGTRIVPRKKKKTNRKQKKNFSLLESMWCKSFIWIISEESHRFDSWNLNTISERFQTRSKCGQSPFMSYIRIAHVEMNWVKMIEKSSTVSLAVPSSFWQIASKGISNGK